MGVPRGTPNPLLAALVAESRLHDEYIMHLGPFSPPYEVLFTASFPAATPVSAQLLAVGTFHVDLDRALVAPHSLFFYEFV
jgi:hypothetical protein